MPKWEYHPILRHSWISKCVCSSANAGTRSEHSFKPFPIRMIKKSESGSNAAHAQLHTIYNARSCSYCTFGYLGPCPYLPWNTSLCIHPAIPALKLAPSKLLHGSCECSLPWLVPSGRKSSFLSRGCVRKYLTGCWSNRSSLCRRLEFFPIRKIHVVLVYRSFIS